MTNNLFFLSVLIIGCLIVAFVLKPCSLFSSENRSDYNATQVFIYNEMSHSLVVKSPHEKKFIRPGKSHIFFLRLGERLHMEKNVTFFYKEVGFLECEKNTFDQVSGIGGPFLKKYGVPVNIEYAFTICPPAQGDTRENSKKIKTFDDWIKIWDKGDSDWTREEWIQLWDKMNDS